MEVIPDVDPLDLVDPDRYAKSGYPHALWTRLRADAPVSRFEPPGFQPFWAITRHADIVAISSQPERFSSASPPGSSTRLRPGEKRASATSSRASRHRSRSA